MPAWKALKPTTVAIINLIYMTSYISSSMMCERCGVNISDHDTYSWSQSRLCFDCDYEELERDVELIIKQIQENNNDDCSNGYS